MKVPKTQDGFGIHAMDTGRSKYVDRSDQGQVTPFVEKAKVEAHRPGTGQDRPVVFAGDAQSHAAVVSSIVWSEMCE